MIKISVLRFQEQIICYYQFCKVGETATLHKKRNALFMNLKRITLYIYKHYYIVSVYSSKRSGGFRILRGYRLSVSTGFCDLTLCAACGAT